MNNVNCNYGDRMGSLQELRVETSISYIVVLASITESKRNCSRLCSIHLVICGADVDTFHFDIPYGFFILPPGSN